MIMKGSKTFKGPSFLHHKTSLDRIQESITKESTTFMTWTEPEETPLHWRILKELKGSSS